MKRIILSILILSITAKAEIYFDSCSTTMLDPRVLNAMLPYFKEEFGNPHSSTHSLGKNASEAITVARSNIASLINCKDNEIIFTSGATESNNLAIKGYARKQRAISGKKHIITTLTEHKAVLETAQDLEKEGFKATYLDVDKNGLISLKDLENSIGPDTSLVSIMMVNNEIGVIQPIEEIANICKKKGITFHCDVAQAIGKIDIDIKKLPIDMMSISGHKIYGPKGIGALYIKDGIEIEPLFSGGAQERALRPGTLPTALCVGLGEAAKIAKIEMHKNYAKISALSSLLITKLQKNLEGIYINGSADKRFHGNINIAFDSVDIEELLVALKGFAISTGSACTSEQSSSYVIASIDKEYTIPPASIRICISKYNTKEEVNALSQRIIKQVLRLRKENPNGGKRLCTPPVK